MDYKSVIIFIHLCIVFFLSTYYFFFKKKTYDYIYLFLNYIMLLQWTCLNGECLVTYVFKVIENNNYIAGENLHHNELNSNSQYETSISYVVYLTNIFVIFNIYMVSKRNKISAWFYLPFIFLFELYFYGNYFFTDHHKNADYLLFQDIIKYMTIVVGILFVSTRV